MKTKFSLFVLFILLILTGNIGWTQPSSESGTLDQKVKTFLDSRQGQWHDMNVPASDGRLLYDIIVENGYIDALEIGTSTGHSGIWIAWALSKTGGKLTTIEINESRYRKALANFEAAGLAEYIDARHADAHNLVKELEGPFDFVFSDADKDWYSNYFKDVEPKLKSGGCFTAHNVRSDRDHRGMRGTAAYLEYVQSLTNFTTTVNNTGGGLAISYKQ